MIGTLPPLGEEIAAHVAEFHLKRGLDPLSAKREGAQIAELLLMLFAGDKISFPSHPSRGSDLEERNREIRRLFNGTNAPVLAVRFNISRSRIWQIVKPDDSTD